MMGSGWSASGPFTTFVQLTPGADPAAIAGRIPSIDRGESRGCQMRLIGPRRSPDRRETAGSYALQPLKSIYFDTEVS